MAENGLWLRKPTTIDSEPYILWGLRFPRFQGNCGDEVAVWASPKHNEEMPCFILFVDLFTSFETTTLQMVTSPVKIPDQCASVIDIMWLSPDTTLTLSGNAHSGWVIYNTASGVFHHFPHNMTQKTVHVAFLHPEHVLVMTLSETPVQIGANSCPYNTCIYSAFNLDTPCSRTFNPEYHPFSRERIMLRGRDCSYVSITDYVDGLELPILQHTGLSTEAHVPTRRDSNNPRPLSPPWPAAALEHNSISLLVPEWAPGIHSPSSPHTSLYKPFSALKSLGLKSCYVFLDPHFGEKWALWVRMRVKE
ncbi:hypothetical protein Pelo_18366 [Pelomyxa schiedti]|nr:hypothetical protein Pelo_18366 [Pelomyxa schiedti]